MKLVSNQLNIWKKNNNFFSLKFILVYGFDEGGIDLVADQSVKNFACNNKVNTLKIDYKNIKDDFVSIYDELNSPSLFGDIKIVVISDCPQSLPKNLLEFLKLGKFSGKLILKAAELKPTSNIRKLAENHTHALSIACYKDDVRQIQTFITFYLRENGIKFTEQVPFMLANLLPANKLLILHELDKLITFKINEVITPIDVELVISDTHEIVLDDLCLAIAQNNKIKILRLIDKSKKQDVNYMIILRTLQKYYVRVLEVLSIVENGSNLEAAVQSLMPPVFFKHKDNLISICKTSKSEKILALIADLVKLELDCKRLPFDEYMLINSYFNAKEF